MIGLILAAGDGRRLGTLTHKTPKPMIKVGSKPVVAHIVDHMEKYGVKRIILVTRYQAEQIYEYFGKRVLYLHTPILYDIDELIETVRDMVDDDLLVMNGDTLTNIRIKSMEEISKRLKISVSFYDKHIYAGTTYYRKNSKSEPEQYNFHGSTYWIDIGTPEGLEKARKHYASNMQ